MSQHFVWQSFRHIFWPSIWPSMLEERKRRQRALVKSNNPRSAGEETPSSKAPLYVSLRKSNAYNSKLVHRARSKSPLLDKDLWHVQFQCGVILSDFIAKKPDSSWELLVQRKSPFLWTSSKELALRSWVEPDMAGQAKCRVDVLMGWWWVDGFLGRWWVDGSMMSWWVDELKTAVWHGRALVAKGDGPARWLQLAVTQEFPRTSRRNMDHCIVEGWLTFQWDLL